MSKYKQSTYFSFNKILHPIPERIAAGRINIQSIVNVKTIQIRPAKERATTLGFFIQIKRNCSLKYYLLNNQVAPIGFLWRKDSVYMVLNCCMLSLLMLKKQDISANSS